MSLEQLWAGWRSNYVVAATEAERQGSGDGCVFCRLAAAGPPSSENGIVWRGERTYVVLNAYPYGSGHLLVLPLAHHSDLHDLDEETGQELWAATRAATEAITAAYSPDGLNMGANLGRAAGAGIPAHLHLHVLPRWTGDTNFMTSVAGVRILPETLEDAWQKLQAAWPEGR